MKVSDQIIDVINALCEKLGVTVDWTTENVLPQIESLCKKYIDFEINTSVFWIVLIAVLCLLSWIPVKPLHKKAAELEWDDDYFITFAAVCMWVVAIGLTIATIVVTGTQIYEIIEANVFPEKTIFDYVTKQISNISN